MAKRKGEGRDEPRADGAEDGARAGRSGPVFAMQFRDGVAHVSAELALARPKTFGVHNGFVLEVDIVAAELDATDVPFKLTRNGACVYVNPYVRVALFMHCLLGEWEGASRPRAREGCRARQHAVCVCARACRSVPWACSQRCTRRGRHQRPSAS